MGRLAHQAFLFPPMMLDTYFGLNFNVPVTWVSFKWTYVTTLPLRFRAKCVNHNLQIGILIYKQLITDMYRGFEL